MSKITYKDFEKISTALTELAKITDDFESLESTIDSISIDDEEVSAMLNSAKQRVKKNIDIIRDVQEQIILDANNLCNEYQEFETATATNDEFLNKEFTIKSIENINYNNIAENKVSEKSIYGPYINEKISKQIEENNANKKTTQTEYTIKSGDTLTKIANRNQTTIEELMKANPNIKDADEILAGTAIVIPGMATTSSRKSTTKKDKTKTEKTEQKEEATKQENINKNSVITDTKTSTSSGKVLGNYRITSYHPSDGSGSGTVTGSGKSVNDFSTMEIDGKNVYTYDGKVVVAAATEELRKAWGRDIIEGKHYFKYGDELTLKINGNEYQAIVLDSCGSSMKAGNQIVDIYVPSSADIINKYDVEIII